MKKIIASLLLTFFVSVHASPWAVISNAPGSVNTWFLIDDDSFSVIAHGALSGSGLIDLAPYNNPAFDMAFGNMDSNGNSSWTQSSTPFNNGESVGFNFGNDGLLNGQSNLGPNFQPSSVPEPGTNGFFFLVLLILALSRAKSWPYLTSLSFGPSALSQQSKLSSSFVAASKPVASGNTMKI